jgi:hypothetical protein
VLALAEACPYFLGLATGKELCGPQTTPEKRLADPLERQTGVRAPQPERRLAEHARGSFSRDGVAALLEWAREEVVFTSGEVTFAGGQRL